MSHHDYQPGLLLMATSVWQRETDRGPAGPAEPSYPDQNDSTVLPGVQSQGAAGLSPGHGGGDTEDWMTATHDGTKFYASNPTGGACSDEQFRAHSRRRPLPLLSWKGGLHQKPLDNKKMMEEESSM